MSELNACIDLFFSTDLNNHVLLHTLCPDISPAACREIWRRTVQEIVVPYMQKTALKRIRYRIFDQQRLDENRPIEKRGLYNIARFELDCYSTNIGYMSQFNYAWDFAGVYVGGGNIKIGQRALPDWEEDDLDEWTTRYTYKEHGFSEVYLKGYEKFKPIVVKGVTIKSNKYTYRYEDYFVFYEWWIERLLSMPEEMCYRLINGVVKLAAKKLQGK
jgi:hypothetical protein